MNILNQEIGRKQKEFKDEIIPHLDAIYNFAFHFTSNQHDAEDLAQDSIMKAYRFFDRFEKGTNGKAWVYRIMQNSFINNYRKERKRPVRVTFDEELECIPVPNASPLSSFARESQNLTDLVEDDLFAALHELPEEFRIPVLLCDMESFTYEEIANILDIPIGTVRSRLSRGRNLLKNQLIEYGKKKGYEAGCLN